MLDECSSAPCTPVVWGNEQESDLVQVQPAKPRDFPCGFMHGEIEQVGALAHECGSLAHQQLLLHGCGKVLVAENARTNDVRAGLSVVGAEGADYILYASGTRCRTSIMEYRRRRLFPLATPVTGAPPPGRWFARGDLRRTRERRPRSSLETRRCP